MLECFWFLGKKKLSATCVADRSAAHLRRFVSNFGSDSTLGLEERPGAVAAIGLMSMTFSGLT